MELKVVNSVFGKARGLMFSRKKNLVFVFDKEQRIGLHMLFVFFPIDVLFLDKDKRIVEIKKNFRPFSFYKSREKAKYVVEIAKGKKKYKIKEKIKF